MSPRSCCMPPPPSPPASGGGNALHARRCCFSKSFDQAGVDQQPIETPCLRAAGAGVKKPLAALENSFLLGERGIERQAGRLLHDERKIGPLDRVERRG